MPLSEYFSAAAVRALPEDGKRYETVHGELLVWRHPALEQECRIDLGVLIPESPAPSSS